MNSFKRNKKKVFIFKRGEKELSGRWITTKRTEHSFVISCGLCEVMCLLIKILCAEFLAQTSSYTHSLFCAQANAHKLALAQLKTLCCRYIIYNHFLRMNLITVSEKHKQHQSLFIKELSLSLSSSSFGTQNSGIPRRIFIALCSVEKCKLLLKQRNSFSVAIFIKFFPPSSHIFVALKGKQQQREREWEIKQQQNDIVKVHSFALGMRDQRAKVISIFICLDFRRKKKVR